MTQLSIVIPVRNEVSSLPWVIAGLTQSLDGVDYQIVVIDDGEDNTPEVVAQMRLPKVKFVRRPQEKRNGLAGAVIHGMKISSGMYIASMDGDGQHPAENIRRMLWKAENETLDMVMASRFTEGGSMEGQEGGLRKFYSRFLRTLPYLLFHKVRIATDPLAGCFLVRSDRLHLDRLRAIGFKISLEILLFSDIVRYGEIGYEFQKRTGGETKTNVKVGLDYFRQLISLMLRFYVYPRSASIQKESVEPQ